MPASFYREEKIVKKFVIFALFLSLAVDVHGQGTPYSNQITNPETNLPGSSQAFTSLTAKENETQGPLGIVNGPVRTKTFYVDGTTYTLETGYTACQAQGSGTVVVSPGYTETLTSPITLTGACSMQLPETGSITVPAGKEFICSASCDVVSIEGKATPIRNPGVSGGIGFKFVCSPGAGVYCFRIGSGTTQFFGVRLRGFLIDTSSGNNTAGGLDLIQVAHYDIDLRFAGPGPTSSQTAVKLDGTGSFTGNERWGGFFSANGYGTCLLLNNTSAGNLLNVICPNSGSTPVVINSGNGNVLYEDIEGATGTANTIAGDANNFQNLLICYCQGNRGTPHDIIIRAGASGNSFTNIGANAAEGTAGITDNGTNDTFPDPYQLFLDPNGSLHLLAGSIFMTTGQIVSWNADTGLSRGGSNKVNCGNGTAGDKSCTFNAAHLVAGADVKNGRQLSSGIAPKSCNVTGAGAGATCAVTATNNTDSFIEITIGVAGPAPAATGTLRINFSSTLGSNRGICQVLPMSNNSAWNARASFQQTSTDTSSWVGNWDNNGVALVAGDSYNVSAICWGR